MKLLLTNSKTIADAQEAFSQLFPHLKIEFFTRPHEDEAASWSKFMIFEHNKTLEQTSRNERLKTAQIRLLSFHQIMK